jgi:hypothetical protein
MTHYCNLVVEFNGLVSDWVNSNVGPFALYTPPPFQALSACNYTARNGKFGEEIVPKHYL